MYKLNLLNKQRFYRDSVQCQQLQQVFRSAVFSALTRFATRLLPCRNNTLFEVNPKICCLNVSSHYCCYGNHAAGSEPI